MVDNYKLKHAIPLSEQSSRTATSIPDLTAYGLAQEEGYKGTEDDMLSHIKSDTTEPLIDPNPTSSDTKIPPIKNRCKLRYSRNVGLLVTTLISIMLAASYAYSFGGYNKTFERYQRVCTLPIESDMELSAVRTYHFPVYQFLGFTLRIDKDVTAETTLQPTFTATNITTILNDEWKSYHTTKGEPTTVILNEADRYVFNQGDKTYVIDSIAFCK